MGCKKILLVMGVSLGLVAVAHGQTRRVNPELGKLVGEVERDEIEDRRRGGRVNIEEKVIRLERQNRQLVRSVREMDQRLAEIEDLVLGPGQPFPGPSRSIVCVVEDSLRGESHLGEATSRLDAEFNARSLCSRAAFASSCKIQNAQCETLR